MVLCAGFGAALALQSTHTSFDQRLSVRITRDHRVLTLLVVNVGMLQDKANILDFFLGGGDQKRVRRVHSTKSCSAPDCSIYIYVSVQSAHKLCCVTVISYITDYSADYR